MYAGGMRVALAGTGTSGSGCMAHVHEVSSQSARADIRTGQSEKCKAGEVHAQGEHRWLSEIADPVPYLLVFAGKDVSSYECDRGCSFYQLHHINAPSGSIGY